MGLDFKGPKVGLVSIAVAPRPQRQPVVVTQTLDSQQLSSNHACWISGIGPKMQSRAQIFKLATAERNCCQLVRLLGAITVTKLHVSSLQDILV